MFGRVARIPWAHATRRRRRRCRSSRNSSHPSQRCYTLAIAREVPRSFPQALSSTPQPCLDVAVAIRQHDDYVQALRRYLPTLCLPALDDLPDSLFVEDTVVVTVGRRAVLTNPGHASRRPEVESMKQLLLQLGMEIVVDMRDLPDDVLCDGGDVLYTNNNNHRHLFVGQSSRTNAAACDVLAEAWADLEVVAVPVPVAPGGPLHLKSLVTALDPETLLVPTGVVGDELVANMRATERGYKVIRLPNMLACNVVAPGGGILAQVQGCHESRSILEAAARDRNLPIDFVELEENAKCDGALTCCSVLLDI